MRKMSKSKMVLASLGLAAFAGLTVASATSLSLSANHDLAAGTSVTQSCQTGTIGVAFDTPVWDATTKSFTVSTVSLSNLNATCDGFDAKVVVANAAGTQLGASTAVLAQATGNQAFSLGATIPSDQVASISVVIY